MDLQRIVLFSALAILSLMLWEAWQQDYGPRREAAPQSTTSQEVDASTQGSDAAPAGGPQDVPEPVVDDVPDVTGAPDAPQPSVGDAAPARDLIRVTTDRFEAHIDPQGGTLVRTALVDYPVDLDQSGQPLRLLEQTRERYFVAQSGLRALDAPAPDHYATYTAERSRYRLEDGQEVLEVPLRWQDPETGLGVTKVYRFQRGRYAVDVEHRVELPDSAEQAWVGSQYRQLQRNPATAGGANSAFLHTYTGGVLHTDENRYQKINFNKLAEGSLDESVADAWIAMIEHYFVAAWVPERADETNRAYSNGLQRPGVGSVYTLGLISPTQTVEPGSSGRFRSTLYVGPKIQSRLSPLADGLELTVDYGYLTVLAQPLFWLLNKIHSVLGNWGAAILILTLLIKLAFYRLSAASYRSMAKMRSVQPKLQALKERYGDDRQRMNQALMDLYKTEKINPLGGCLPILVQIPFFIALYWVLLESVELRHASFLWVQDLSSKDPLFILPVLMGVSMFLQQKISPAPLDPVQQKVMMALPIVFTGFFAFFPAGLVLYWLANNVLSIAQQWYITRQMEGKTAKAGAS